jgi:ubiquinone/menaquinone biosynthesis C-methylase UbiE
MPSLADFSLYPSVTNGFANSTSYDLHRPSYPFAAVSSFLSHLNIAGVSNAKIVEIAAGTGKFTEILVMREEGFEVEAVEPHSGMREGLLGKNLGEEGKGMGKVRVLDGVAAKMEGLEDEWGDAAIVAQVSLVISCIGSLGSRMVC